MDAILDNCRHGNTTQYLIKWAVSTVSTPGKVTWSGSTVILSYPSSDAVDSCIRLLCLHSTLRWQILHALLTATWSSHCPVTPTRHCTWKTLSQTSRWSCQSSTCHMALTTASPWPVSLILTHGTMCTTWQIPDDSISVQLSCHQEPSHGDLQAQPEDLHRPVDDDASSPCLWAGQTGRRCCWAGETHATWLHPNQSGIW